MAFTRLASVSAGSSNGNDVTTGNIDTTGANLLVLVACVDWAITTPTISDSKGNTWTRIVQGTSSGALRCDIWYSIPTSVGTGHNFTQSDTSSFGSIAVSAYSGAGASPVDQSNTGDTGGGGATSLQVGSVTPTKDNELIIAGLAGGVAAVGYSIDESLTVDASTNGAGGLHYGVALASLIETTATLKDPTWSVNLSTQLAAVIATFKVPFAGTLTAAKGTFTETGKAASLLRGAKLAAAAGAYALSGPATGLLVGRKLVAGKGIFLEVGNDARLLKGSKLPAAVGTFVLTGQAAGLLVGRIMRAGAGTYTLAGASIGPLLLFGSTKDGSSIPLAGALVELFRADTHAFITSTLSRADGTFMLQVPTALEFVEVWLRAWEAGSPQLAGTSCTDTVRRMIDA